MVQCLVLSGGTLIAGPPGIVIVVPVSSVSGTAAGSAGGTTGGRSGITGCTSAISAGIIGGTTGNVAGATGAQWQKFPKTWP